MSPGTAAAAAETKNVGMGQIAIARTPAQLGTVLGSCVGIAIFDPRSQWGALGHVVLPDSHGRPANPGKFANTAVAHMLQLLKEQGARPAGLIAKIAGGACMFESAGPMQIGDANVRAVLRALEAAGVKAAAKDVGGTSGRRILLDCRTGALTVQTAGNPARML
jgi:chemotaxis protein CheD